MENKAITGTVAVVHEPRSERAPHVVVLTTGERLKIFPGEMTPEIRQGARGEFIYYEKRGEYNGRPDIQLIVKSFRIVEYDPFADDAQPDRAANAGADRDKLIVAQVALKEACALYSARAAMGIDDGDALEFIENVTIKLVSIVYDAAGR